MKDKKDFTMEELEEKRAKVKKEYEAIEEQITLKKKEERKKKEAELAQTQETRKKEVDEALERYKQLASAYMRDYGTYSFSTVIDDLGAFFGHRPCPFNL